MSETLIAALLGGGFALATLIVTLFFQHKDRRAETDQRYAEIFLAEEIRRVNELVTAITMWFDLIWQWALAPPSTEASALRLESVPHIKKCMHAHAAARIFLPDPIEDKVDQLLSRFVETSSLVEAALEATPHPPNTSAFIEEVDWKDLAEQYIATIADLQSLLNPPALNKMRGRRNHL